MLLYVAPEVNTLYIRFNGEVSSWMNQVMGMETNFHRMGFRDFTSVLARQQKGLEEHLQG